MTSLWHTFTDSITTLLPWVHLSIKIGLLEHKHYNTDTQRISLITEMAPQ
jgi:hypothetical protein